MNKKLLILSFLCLLTTISGKAQTLLLWNETSVIQRIQLNTKPVVKILDDKLVIVSEGMSFEYDFKDIRRFSCEGVTNGVRNAETELTLHRDGERILICEAASTDAVALYTLKGERVPVSLTRSDDGVVLSLSSLATGVYLLKVNGRTTKLTKK